MRKGSAVSGPNRMLYGLIFLAMFLSLGHHIDHVIRGNHVGWPLTEHVTPFTYSLGVYPLIFLGLYLYASGRVGPGFWALLSGSGGLFVAAIHFGPAAVEPLADIVNLYEPRIIGWLAFAWLMVFVMVLVATCMYEVRSWLHQRKARSVRPRGVSRALFIGHYGVSLAAKKVDDRLSLGRPILARALVYLLALLVPPLLVGVLGMKAAESARYEGPAAAVNVDAGRTPAPPLYDPDKPTAVVLLGNEGSEVTDVLAPYEVLSESGAFNVYAAAPERQAVPLSGGLDVLPQLSLAELDRRLGGEDPDVIVVPAMPDVGSPGHRPVAEWLREHAEGSGTVVSVCAGAEVLADAGLLAGRRATANWAGIEEWEGRYPETEWVRGLRYVEDGNVLTAAAVTSGVGATLHVVRGYVGEAAAEELAREIGYPDQRIGAAPRLPAKHLTAGDAALYVLGAAYGWGKPRIGIVLPEGVSEIELASVSDVYPGQSFTADTTTLAPGGPRSPVRSEHGLYFVPRSDLAGAPKLARVLVPGRDAPSAIGPRVSSWARDRGLKLEFIHSGTPAGFPFDATLSDLAEHENVPVAEFRAKGLEYPTEGLELSGDGWPFPLLLRPLAVGLLGLALAVLLDRLLGPATKRFRHFS